MAGHILRETSNARWDIFGRWPSAKDLDLVLVATEEQYAKIRGFYYDNPCPDDVLDVAYRELPLPTALLDEAARVADAAQVSLDLKLAPDDERPWVWVATVVRPPYTRAQVNAGPMNCTPDEFFSNRRPLDLPMRDDAV